MPEPVEVPEKEGLAIVRIGPDGKIERDDHEKPPPSLKAERQQAVRTTQEREKLIRQLRDEDCCTRSVALTGMFKAESKTAGTQIEEVECCERAEVALQIAGLLDHVQRR